MTAVEGTILQVVGIMNRGRGDGSRENKAMIGIYRGVLLQAVERFVIFNCPIWFEVSIEFFRFTLFIEPALLKIWRPLSNNQPFVLLGNPDPRNIDITISNGVNLRVYPGRMAGGFNQPGINGNTFIDRQALFLVLAEDFAIYLIHGIFRQSFSEPRECGVIWRGVAEGEI